MSEQMKAHDRHVNNSGSKERKVGTINVQTQKIGIVGATGAFGMSIIRVLKDHLFPVTNESLRLFASAASTGKTIRTPFGNKHVESFSLEAARECDFLFLAVSDAFVREHVSALTRDSGPYVIASSSAFHGDDHIPLVVPEINAYRIHPTSRLIANPKSTTTIAVMALWPLHERFSIRRLLVTTYCAASSAGQVGVQELKDGLERILIGRQPSIGPFPHALPFNVIPHIGSFRANGYTEEEMKVVSETKQILGDDLMDISCTAVSVPTLQAHAASLVLETQWQITPDIARDVLRTVREIQLVDDPEANRYPMPLTTSEKNKIELGRIRQSLVFGKNGLEIFGCGDHLRVSACNAVRIAEAILAPERFPRGAPARFNDYIWEDAPLWVKSVAGLVAIVGIGYLVKQSSYGRQ